MLTPEEHAAFVAAAKPVYDKWKERNGTDLVELAEKAIEQRAK